MGDIRRDDGPPEDDGEDRGPVAGGPGEWATIIVPDDAAEFAAEARAVRRELRRQARRGNLGRLVGPTPPARPAAPRSDGTPTGLGVPFLIIAVAVLVTVLSLFVITWSPGAVRPTPTGTTPASVERPGAPASTPTRSGTAVRSDPGAPTEARLPIFAPEFLLTPGR